MMDPGFRLRQIRERLGLTYRDVQRATLSLSRLHARPNFTIHISRLADIENAGVVPSLHKLYALADLPCEPSRNLELVPNSAGWIPARCSLFRCPANTFDVVFRFFAKSRENRVPGLSGWHGLSGPKRRQVRRH